MWCCISSAERSVINSLLYASWVGTSSIVWCEDSVDKRVKVTEEIIEAQIDKLLTYFK